MQQLKRLVQQIHRRSLWQVLLIYVGASWAVLEAADVLIERLALPDWIYGLAIILLLVGLPIVLATAFVQEGVAPARREIGPPTREMEAAAPSAAATDKALRRLLTWRNAVAGGVLAFALWGMLAAGWVLFGPETALAPGRGDPEEAKSVAVLPFDNLSPDPENEFFAAGIHEEIITQLSKIRALQVISRTSVMEYENRPQNLKQIADELGVANIVEGSVRRAEERVRITAQLIDARTDRHLWAETYDRELTDVFAIQSDVAQRIADALKASLSPAEREQLDRKPTDNLEAYEFYLQGNHFLARSVNEQDVRVAIQMYEKAVELDPDFAVAHAKLSEAHAKLYWLDHDRSPDRLAAARGAAERALELVPDLPEARVALGYYHYWGHLDYERALDQLARAAEMRPSDADVAMAIGAVYRRQGRWQEAADRLKEAVELDPRSAEKAVITAQTLRLMRRYPEAERYYDRALEAGPERTRAHALKALLHLNWKGDTERAREILQSAADYLDWRDVDVFVTTWHLVDLADGRYDEALARLDSVPPDPLRTPYEIRPVPMLRAQIYGLQGRSDQERAAYESATVLLQGELSARSDDPLGQEVYRASLAVALAGAGQSEQAVREARAAAAALPPSREAWRGTVIQEVLARVYAMTGEYEQAVELLDSLLSRPGELSVPLLRIDPTWGAIRDDKRFRELLNRQE